MHREFDCRNAADGKMFMHQSASNNALVPLSHWKSQIMLASCSRFEHATFGIR